MTAVPSVSADEVLTTESAIGAGGCAAGYFPRHLHLTDRNGEIRYVDESMMLATEGAKIVLGEPGMGKSELMREAGRRLDAQVISAVRFMVSRNPAELVVSGKPLLIDGLDEAMARRDGDAVDMILAQLEEAGSPQFVLSCRAREWQKRSVSNLREIYGAEPTIFTIEPLSHLQARAFLERRYAKADADHVLNHLDQNSLADLYRNPLTLGLMGRVAEHDMRLPPTRAALFERVCSLIWPEHDDNRQDSGLGQLTEDQALSSAGAIMAGLMFAGAEAVSLAGPSQLLDGDLRLVDLETLPSASAARAIFSSKLYYSDGVGRAKPIHRVVAEYLGARWLARQATTPRAQRRLLAQLQGGGAVPASLRGVHAWLACHSPAMAERVIAADPFGVLRYGETANLTAAQADSMFHALFKLAEVDPFFRVQDWDSHTVAGLMTSRLRDKIDATIRSTASNEHLRSLLIEGLKDTPLSSDLADTLEAVMFSGQRFYREREDAAEALFPHRNRTWWQHAIDDLRIQGTEDSTRLAKNLIEKIDCDASDELLVATLFAEMGLTICPLPRIEKRRVHMSCDQRRIIDALPSSRLVGVLNLVSDYVDLFDNVNWESGHDLTEIASRLLVRAIVENVIGPSDAGALWRWLGALRHLDDYSGNTLENLRAQLDQRDDLRHAIQFHALYVARRGPTIWASDFDLAHRMVGLQGRARDVTWFLDRLAGADNKDPVLRQDWCDLMRLGIGRDGFDPDLRAASRKFQRDDAQLEAFVHKIEHRKKPAWVRRREREAAKRAERRRINTEGNQRYFSANRAALLAGDLGAILQPAKAYLGHFPDLKREQPPAERIAKWLGPDLRDDTMVGFEAVLHRPDLPTPAEIAKGFAEGTMWNYSFAIMAGLLARQRAGNGFGDLVREVHVIGLLLCHNERGICFDDDLRVLQAALEAEVISTAKDREDFARLWIEPSLAAGCSHVRGLYTLARDEDWQATGAALAGGWLTDFPNIPEKLELQLVECLTRSGAFVVLASIAAARANGVFRNKNHELAWLAIDVLVRFDTVKRDLAGIGARTADFIWFLRDRLQFEGHGKTLSITISQSKWIISEFRGQWPYTSRMGSSSGDTNPHDATDFLRVLIDRIADDTSVEASDALQELIAEPPDSYTDLIRHMAAEQRQKLAEKNFAPLPPRELSQLLAEGPPSNIDDLKSLVLEELAITQKKLIGSDLDEIRDFWNDAGVPHDENRCRDRLAAMISPELTRYDVQRITEADMPMTKRADLAFARDQLQLPMEVKGQWHPNVWDAATDQLDVQYLIDWRSHQRGIYCVLWFGDLPSRSGRRLRVPPKGLKRPKMAEEMCRMLIERIPAARRALIDVVVLDLSKGRP